MKPSTLFRTLSSKIPARLSSSPVAPWPVRTAFDKWLMSELTDLQLPRPELFASANWQLKALDVAVAVQKMAMRSISVAQFGPVNVDRKAVDDHLEDVVELMDACNGLRGRMETIREYVGSLGLALHWLEGEHEPSNTALGRAKAVLDSCGAVEKRWGELEKCGSNLRRLGEKLQVQNGMDDHAVEFHEALVGSKAVALFVIGMLGIGLSFKSKRGLPMIQSCKVASWSSSLHELHKQVKEEVDKRRKNGVGALKELDSTVSAARSLREIVSRRIDDKALGRLGELKAVASALKRSCRELEEGVKAFEGRVNELYRQLICIRMTLLGLL